jgi:hypothetical protein
MGVRRPSMRTLLLLPGTLLLAFVITLPITWRHLHAQVLLGFPLRHELGFTESSPYTPDPRYPLGQREVVAVADVTPNGIAARAGLRPDDVFVDYCRRDRGATALFLDLEDSRGGKYCTPVVGLFAPGILESRERRRVCFLVPGKEKRRT